MVLEIGTFKTNLFIRWKQEKKNSLKLEDRSQKREIGIGKPPTPHNSQLKELKSINRKARKGLRKARKELIHMFLTLRTLRSYPPKL
jgi:hypothetical protein